MQLSKAWDSSALVAGLKSTSLADAPKIVGDFFGILFGWIVASLAMLAAASPALALLGGFIPELANLVQAALVGSLSGLSISIQPIVISKAWDVPALVAALKAAGIPDAEKLLVDDVSVLFDWVGSSLAMGSVIEKGLAPLMAALASMIDAEIQSLVAKA